MALLADISRSPDFLPALAMHPIDEPWEILAAPCGLFKLRPAAKRKLFGNSMLKCPIVKT